MAAETIPARELEPQSRIRVVVDGAKADATVTAISNGTFAGLLVERTIYFRTDSKVNGRLTVNPDDEIELLPE